MRQLEAEYGIQTRAYFNPACHTQLQFEACLSDGLPITEEVAARIICLPLWYGMDEQTVEYIVDSLAALSN